MDLHVVGTIYYSMRRGDANSDPACMLQARRSLYRQYMSIHERTRSAQTTQVPGHRKGYDFARAKVSASISTNGQVRVREPSSLVAHLGRSMMDESVFGICADSVNRKPRLFCTRARRKDMRKGKPGRSKQSFFFLHLSSENGYPLYNPLPDDKSTTRLSTRSSIRGRT
jgi:hypothetical protein